MASEAGTAMRRWKGHSASRKASWRSIGCIVAETRRSPICSSTLRHSTVGASDTRCRSISGGEPTSSSAVNNMSLTCPPVHRTRGRSRLRAHGTMNGKLCRANSSGAQLVWHCRGREVTIVLTHWRRLLGRRGAALCIPHADGSPAPSSQLRQPGRDHRA
jgi:hypothetical protein